MAAVAVCFLFLLAMTGRSSATYCVCNTGLSNAVLQTDIDYACGNGADCSAIQQNGACYNPSTVQDHCNYAVNSYYQNKNQVTGSCNFSGTATTSQTIPTQASGCVYPSSASTAGNGTSQTITPSSSTTPSTTTPSTGSTGTPPSVFGLGPTGSGGITNTGNKASLPLHQNTKQHLFWSFTLILFFSGPVFFRL